MAMIQHNKHKVYSVMDYRELNEHVDTFEDDADVCAAKMREWCITAGFKESVSSDLHWLIIVAISDCGI